MPLHIHCGYGQNGLEGVIMGEKDFLVDAVAQYLQTNAWQDAIAQFFAAHYAKFPSESADEKLSKGVGYTLEQFDVFTQFRDLMERLLEAMIAEMGCSGEDLVEILQESIRNGPTGERRFLIKTLLSFEDYADFHARITEYASQLQQQQSEGNADLSEWQMQLAVAQSLLDADAQGLLDETEQSFLPWAEALVGMSQSNRINDDQQQIDESKADETEEGADMTTQGNDRLKELECTLIRERLKVDLLIAQRIAEANAALKKDMLHLSVLEVEQSEEQEAKSAEQDLDSLFSQIETIRDRLKVVKSNCFDFKNVTHEAMDQLYLFLKEKIHYQQDLVAQEKEISDYVFSLIPESDAPLIPLLLEWLLLESEGLRVQRQIQDELGQPTSSNYDELATEEGFWTQSWDENAQACFYFHSISGESVWEPPIVGFYDANQEYHTRESIVGNEYTAQDQQGYSEQGEILLGLSEATTVLEEQLRDSSIQDPRDMLEMEQVLEKISREHDEERKRLELVFELEKARQKEELRRRKEKKRHERHLKKKKKGREEQHDEIMADGDEIADESKESEITMTFDASKIIERPIVVEKAELKNIGKNEEKLGSQEVGRARLDLAHLLSEAHAKRQLEKNGLTVPLAPSAQALLNPTSLRFLTEALAKKNPESWLEEGPQVLRPAAPTYELLLEEADEK